MSRFVQTETANVFRDPLSNRRFFSKNAALNSRARSLAKKRCDCEKGDDETGGGFACDYHAHDPRKMDAVQRLVRWYKIADRATEVRP